MKNLDPRDPAAKQTIKASIVDAIANEIPGSTRADIARAVEFTYERLLVGAKVFAHIPALTQGMARRQALAGHAPVR